MASELDPLRERPELMDTFPNSEAVNDTLRKYLPLTAAKRA